MSALESSSNKAVPVARLYGYAYRTEYRISSTRFTAICQIQPVPAMC